MRKLILLALLLCLAAVLGAQSTLAVNGLNEAKFIYRTVPDSLHVYFRDSFAFGLSYRNFSFGMKFIAELPKYSTSQSDLLEDLAPERLGLGWKELYVSYAKDDYLLHAGTIEETFGSGIAFRSFQDLEFDTDNRVTGFKFGYDGDLQVKALYGAILNADRNNDSYDLAYGMDAAYSLPALFTPGLTALQMRIGNAFGGWDTNNVYGGRLKLISGVIEAAGEYYLRDHQRPDTGLPAIEGSALYATLAVSLSPVQFGGAFKDYSKFQYRLQDLPLANHHNETLADNQGSGVDEQGFQGWVNFQALRNLSVMLDYAEAWSADKHLKMNDAYAGLDWIQGEVSATLSYSHVEKVDDILQYWQQELYPAFNVSFPAWSKPVVLSGEFKTVSKQRNSAESSHYEPKLQADITVGKLGLSLGAQSWWEDFSSLTDSRYWTNLELKYPLLADSELIFFAGSEAGGKVCRNGVCRYMAPFSGVRLELNTRF